MIWMADKVVILYLEHFGVICFCRNCHSLACVQHTSTSTSFIKMIISIGSLGFIPLAACLLLSSQEIPQQETHSISVFPSRLSFLNRALPYPFLSKDKKSGLSPAESYDRMFSPNKYFYSPKQSLFPSRKILLFSQSRILVKTFSYSVVVSFLWKLIFKGLFPQQKRFVRGFSFPQRSCSTKTVM